MLLLFPLVPKQNHPHPRTKYGAGSALPLGRLRHKSLWIRRLEGGGYETLGTLRFG
jgi:hypothetical protein